MSSRMLSVDFEVFGRVQGVFFRKYTRDTAKNYGLVGWCRNTSQGTVKGQMQGNDVKIKEMKDWLEKVGSPHSKVMKAEFSNEKEISKLDYAAFGVKH